MGQTDEPVVQVPDGERISTRADSSPLVKSTLRPGGTSSTPSSTGNRQSELRNPLTGNCIHVDTRLNPLSVHTHREARDGNLTALLSAYQSIGGPRPVKIFGTEDQKRRFLPRCAVGAISGFALTEPDVGSDPASLSTTATPSADGSHFVLDGEKLWCTNGTIAELLVVMARNPET